ncbi:hypothetical protein P4H42_16655, partial [Paenibacillus macerans]|uniref:hypothetical protein n=1 Tax=Paenibacillus macerans TaxID=44252 RepID=UPI002DB9E3DC
CSCNASAKSAVIPAISDHSSEIKEFYVAIFLSSPEITCFLITYRKIGTRNAVKGDGHAWIRVIST